MHFLASPLNPLWVKITPMEITPMKKTSHQIHGLSKGCLGIYIFFSDKTVATGGEKVIGAVGTLIKQK